MILSLAFDHEDYDYGMKELRAFFKLLIPPILWKLILGQKKLFWDNRNFISQVGGFKYGFTSFESAEAFLATEASQGYSSQDFIKKLQESASLVRDGKAVYERDTFVFDEIIYSWPLVSSLFMAANRQQILRIIDFGGGLGSSFRQNEKLLNLIDIQVKWTILEQPLIADIGRKYFENDSLSFSSNINELTGEKIDLFLLSGSLCYIRNPYQLIEQIISIKPRYIVLDRTPFIDGENDSYGLQYVPASIFEASYPITFFARNKMFDVLSSNYTLIAKWISDDQPDNKSTSEGSLWSLK